MKTSLIECKRKSNIAAEFPIEEKAVLFIESYNGEKSGNCFSVLSELLNDKEFSTWKIYWAVPDSVYIDNRVETHKEQVCIVKNGSTDFITALQTARLIISGDLLPSYYVKREGQLVVGLYSANLYDNWIKANDNSQTKNGKTIRLSKAYAELYRSIVKSDILYIETDEIDKALRSKFPQGSPFTILKGEPLRHLLKVQNEAEIVVSVTDKTMGMTYPNLEKLFKEVKTIAIDYDKEVFFRIPHLKYLQYQNENDPKVTTRIGSNAVPVCQDIERAELLITDRKGEYYEACRLGIPTIVITGDATSWNSYGNAERLFAGNWNEVCEQIEYFFREEMGRKNENNAVLPDIFSLMNEINVNLENNSANYNKGDILLVISSALTHEVWKVLGCMSRDVRLEIFFREDGNGSLWKCGDWIDETADIYYQMKKAVSTVTPLERKINRKNKESTLSDYDLLCEWRRSVGERQFKKIYYVGDISDYWERMLEISPSDSYDILSKKEFVSLLLEKIRSPLTNISEDGLYEKDIFEGDSDFHLATDGADILLLKDFNKENGITLVFVDKNSDIAECRKLITEEPERTYLIFDPHELMRSHKDIIGSNNVRWMPLRKFPVRAFLVADRIALLKDSTLCQIAEHYGKEVDISEKDRNKDEMSKYIGLLACESIYQMVGKS